MTDLEPQRESYQRLLEEPFEEYDLFTSWCKIPPSARTIKRLSEVTTISQRKIKQIHDRNEWLARAADYDNDSRQLLPDPANMDIEASRAAQLAAASILLDLGLSAISVKDPSLLSAKQSLEIVKVAAEMQRKALGEADHVVKFTSDDIGNVMDLVADVLELEEENPQEAEIVSEDIED